MNITDVRIRLVPGDNKLKAVASVTIDDAIVIHDVKILSGENDVFVAMPSRKLPSGEYKDVAHPVNAEARTDLVQRVLAAYKDALDSAE